MSQPWRTIELTRGYVALVDADDYDYLNQFSWQADVRKNVVYASRTLRVDGVQKWRYMHRDILGVTDPKVKVDHRNHNGLDNQRHNIRKSSHQQNHRNQKPRGGSSKYKGVFFFKERKKFTAHVVINRKQIYLGIFKEEIDAARAYDAFAKKHFGEFACLNFPEEGVYGTTVVGS